MFLTTKSISSNHKTGSDSNFFEKISCLDNEISAVGFIKSGFCFLVLTDISITFKIYGMNINDSDPHLQSKGHSDPNHAMELSFD